jgi:hypothetical protein
MVCFNCHKLLIPYVYAEHTRQLYQMEQSGMLIMGEIDEWLPGYPTYYCRYCDENHYFTDGEIVKKSSKKSFAKKQKN